MMELKYESGVFIPVSRKLFAPELVNPDAIVQYLPFISLIQSTQDVKQSGFSGTGRTYNTQDLPFLNVYIDTFQNLKVAIVLLYSRC